MSVLVALTAHGGAADDLGQKKQQRDQVAVQMTQIRAQIAAAQNQEAALQAIIDRLGAQILATEATVSAAQNRLDAINAELADAQDHLAVVRAKLAGDKASLAQQMVTVYEMGAQSTTLTNILGAGDFNEFTDRVLNARRIAGAQDALTRVVLGEEADVEQTIAKIAAAKAAQQRTIAQLKAAVNNLNAELDTETQARAYMAQIQAQDTQRLAELAAAEAQLNAQIAELEAEQAAAAARGGGNGRFGWPLTGPITQGFGCTSYPFEPYDPSCASRHFHSGLDIAPGCGTPIHAADSGIVNEYWTNWGYGHYIVMIYGNGWSGVYGHMASFTVGNGQAVTRGQVIGYEGSTGNSTGCHLHFEIRYNNVPRNPLAYLS